MSSARWLTFLLCTFATTGWAQEDGWTEISNDNGITVYRKSLEGSEVVSFRGETVIPATPKDVFAVLSNNAISHEWIPMVAAKKDIEQLSETRRLEYIHIEMPWPLTDRYFVNAAEVTFLPDGGMKAFVQSVNHPTRAEDDKVLGYLHYSEFLLTPIDGGSKTYMRIEVNSDPKGMIPKWLVNLAQKTWPVDFFTGLTGQLAEREQLSH